MDAKEQQELRDEFQILCEAAIDANITDKQLRRLENIIQEHEAMRVFYVRYMRQHAFLMQRRHVSGISEFDRLRRGKQESWFRLIGMRHILSAALILIVVSSAVFLLAKYGIEHAISPAFHGRSNSIESASEYDSDAAKTFGIFHVRSDNVVWGGGTVPIEDGERLGRRMIHLLEGIVQINYDNGVHLIIQGPTKIELSRFDHCFLHSGSIEARVSPSGVGFTVDTYSARIEDRGTEFGVYVQDENNSSVRVFKGHVDVHPAGDDVSIPLTTGRKIRFSDVCPDTAPVHKEPTDDSRATALATAGEIIRKTVDGQGKEARIVYEERKDGPNSSQNESARTHGPIEDGDAKRSRQPCKIYFTIDLSGVPISTFSDAVLELGFIRTGIDTASSSVQNALFSVYGLLDECGDYWEEGKIDWKNAPANRPGATEIDLNQAMMIGQLELLSTEKACIKRISGNVLRRFIESDTNRLLTFIVVCEIQKNGNPKPIFTLADRRHDELPPPTLRLIMDDKDVPSDTDAEMPLAEVREEP